MRAFDTVAKVLLAITMLIVFVALEQGFSPRVCIANNGASHVVPLEDSEGKVHQCQSRSDCVDADLGVDEFLCERIGLMGTYSDGGRVRYMGIFQDPNELRARPASACRSCSCGSTTTAVAGAVAGCYAVSRQFRS